MANVEKAKPSACGARLESRAIFIALCIVMDMIISPAFRAGSAPDMVGIDIGGAFTDFVYRRPGGLRIHKLLTTRSDLSLAFLQGLADLDLAAESIVVHGTTVATNAVLEHKGARAAQIVTAGFRDLLTIGRGQLDEAVLDSITRNSRAPG
jgi:hypothetical protein